MDAPLATSALGRDEIGTRPAEGLTEWGLVILVVDPLQRLHAAVIPGGALRLLFGRENRWWLNWPILRLASCHLRDEFHFALHGAARTLNFVASTVRQLGSVLRKRTVTYWCVLPACGAIVPCFEGRIFIEASPHEGPNVVVRELLGDRIFRVATLLEGGSCELVLPLSVQQVSLSIFLRSLL